MKDNNTTLPSTEQIKEQILTSDKPTLVDFYATWCGPCRVQHSILKYFMADHGDDINLVQINIDGNDELANYFNVKSVPTILYVRDGNILARKIGLQGEESLLKMIRS